ncbi:MAG: HAMP domain-containing histidine kinase [Clostridiales bacterium]|nr:HAMP domain-containing histidine kinase [Clostridiales bacterium]
MKQSIYFKLFLGYVSFAVITLLLITTFLEPKVYDYNERKIGNQLYKQAYSLSQRYGKYHYDIVNNNYNYANEITTLAYATDSIIWITDSNGRIVSSSENYFSQDNIEGLGEYFGHGYYTVGTLDNFLSNECISVVAPIVNDFTTYGYILISKQTCYVETDTIYAMNNIYFVAALILSFSLIIVIVFTITVYIPLKKITRASKELAKGNFDYDGLKIKTNDEMGLLAANMNYMAGEFKTIDDKQRKFISNCSHDFRSPLTSIKGYLEAMLDGTIPPEKYDKYLNILLSEAERLNRLTSSLLTLNTGNGKGLNLDMSEFDIVTVVRSSLLSFEGQCNRKKITLDVTFGAKSYMVMADQVKIQQVLYNLIDNAIKFSHANSTITINVLDKNELVFVSIKDAGIGIPRESLNKIWDRFYKTDISRGKDKTGSGLGLSIAKEIITSHNENINVISTEGVGTEFIFTLHKSKKNILPIIPS